MPRIPQYDRQAGIPAGQTGARLDTSMFSVGGAQLGKIGDAVADFSAAREKARNEADLMRARATASKELMDLHMEFDQDNDWRTMENRFKERTQEIHDRLSEGITDPRAREVFSLSYGEMAAAKRVSVHRRSWELESGQARSDLDELLTNNARNAATAANPVESQRFLKDGLESIKSMQAAGYISAEDAGRRERRFLGEHDEVKARSMIQADPTKAMEALSGGAFPNLEPRQLQFLQEHASSQAEQRKRIAEAEARAARAELREEARYAHSILSGGGTYAGLPALLKRAEAMDPKLATSLKLAQQDADWSKGVSAMSPQDAVAEIDRTKAAAEKATDPMLADMLWDRVKRGGQIVTHMRDVIQKDGLGWAEAQGVIPKTELNPSQPDTVAARAAAVAKARDYYGRKDIPFLKPAEVAAVADRYASAPNTAEKLDVLRSWTLGLNDPAVAREAGRQLVKAGIPEQAFYALEVARDPSRTVVARRVLSELSTPEKEFGLASGDSTKVNEDALKTFNAGMGAVLQRATAVTGNEAYQEQHNQHFQAVRHVAKARTAAGVSDPAQAAYKDIFGHLGTYSEDGLAHVYFPSNTDKDAMLKGFQALRAKGVDELAATIKPEDKVTGKQLEAAVFRPLRQRGVWVNDGEGFVLIDPTTGHRLAVNGKPYRKTLDEVITAGKGVADDVDVYGP